MAEPGRPESIDLDREKGVRHSIRTTDLNVAIR
jgi:hypothetical protein